MRIALLLCGEPRYSAVAARGILTDICDPLRRCGHTVDVLFAMWTTRMRPGTQPVRGPTSFAKDSSPRVHNYDEQILLCRTFKPMAAAFFTKPVIDVSWLQALCNPAVTSYGMYCQFLSWYLGKQLLEQVESVHGKYDLVMRSRADILPQSELLLPAPLAATVYVPAIEGHTDRPFDVHSYCNDQFALGNRDVMGRYLELHLHYTALKAEMKHFDLPERLLRFYLLQHVGCGFSTFPLRYVFQR
jgi:hypothetical protein